MLIVTITNAIDGNSGVSLTPCASFWGMSFYCLPAMEAGTLCDDWISGDDCGAAGEYSIYKEIEVPEEAEQINTYNMPISVTIKASVGDDECDIEAETEAEMNMAHAGVGAVALVGAYALFKRRRRRTVAAIDLDDDENKGQHFVQMADASSSMGGGAGVVVV